MSERPPKQAQKRLGPDEVDRLVAAHLAGAGVNKLAARFGVHRDTVHHILERKRVLRRRGMKPRDLSEAIRLYEAGWSLARLAAEFDVSPSTISRALRQADVATRRPGPPRRPSAS